MKAFVLARVSDKNQDSNEAQLGRMGTYLELKQFSPIVEFEIKESSTKADREQFYEIIEQIKREKDCVAFIVDTIDRMQRSFRESVILDDMRKNGKVEIHFFRENLRLHKDSNSADLIRWDMGVMFARSYVLQLSDNVKRKLEYMRKSGTLPGKAPYGYRNITLEDGKTKDIIVDEFESRVVIKMYEWYASGAYSLLLVRKKLKADFNLDFSNGYIDVILKNPFYYGEMLSKGKLYSHKYQAIITKELFNKVQQIKKGYNKKHFKFAGLPYEYRGMIRCGLCGCMITPEKAKDRYVYYHCTNYHKKHSKSDIEWLREEEITRQFAQLLKRIQIPEEVLSEITESLKSVHKGKSEFREEQFTKLTQEKNKYAKRIENMYKDKLDGCITSDEYDKLYKEFRAKIDETDTRLSNLQKAEDDYYLTTGYLLELANKASELFESSEIEEKRQLLKLIVQNPTLDGRIVRYDVLKPFDTILKYADNKLWLPKPSIIIALNQAQFEIIIKGFQNLSYIGELRQRWNEIRKIQQGVAISY